jgi:hypothetical protein
VVVLDADDADHVPSSSNAYDNCPCRPVMLAVNPVV